MFLWLLRDSDFLRYDRYKTIEGGRSMIITIEEICEKTLDALRTAKYNESTIRNYTYTLGFLKKYAEEQNCFLYTSKLGNSFQKLTSHPVTGEFSLQRYKMRHRCVSILNRFYETESFDLSMSKPGLLFPSSLPLAKEHQKYLEFLRTEFTSENTIHFYRYMNYCFLQFLSPQKISSIAVISNRLVVDYLISTKDTMQRAALCGLRHYLQFIARQDLFNAITGISGIRIRTIIPTLSKEEQESLWNVLDSENQVSYRDKAIFLLSLTSGMRACDIVSLNLSDINWHNDTISFIQKKTGNAVNLPLLPVVGNAVVNYLIYKRPKVDSSYLFLRDLAPYEPLSGHSSCYKIIKTIFICANVSFDERICGTRMLRHNAASAMLKNGVPLETIAAVLGHADPNTTDIYLTTDDEKLRDCVLPLIPVTKGVLS